MLVYSVKLPPPFGYSLLSKRESRFPCLSTVYINYYWIRGHCVMSNVCLSAAEFRNIQSFSFGKLKQASEWKFTNIYNERSIVSILSKECRACEIYQKLVFEDGGV